MEDLRRMREEAGFTQVGLAKASGVDRGTIIKIESGKRSPSIATLEGLARAMSVEVADFFPKVEPPLFDDLVEESRAIDDKRREERRRFFKDTDALSDDQLAALANGLRWQDVPRQWSNERAKREEVATRRFMIGAMLQIRAGTATEREREYLAALTA